MALIAFGGSPLGIGQDGKGSIRVPSHWCGTIGVAPSIDRVSIARSHPPLKNSMPHWTLRMRNLGCRRRFRIRLSVRHVVLSPSARARVDYDLGCFAPIPTSGSPVVSAGEAAEPDGLTTSFAANLGKESLRSRGRTVWQVALGVG